MGKNDELTLALGHWHRRQHHIRTRMLSVLRFLARASQRLAQESATEKIHLSVPKRFLSADCRRMGKRETHELCRCNTPDTPSHRPNHQHTHFNKQAQHHQSRDFSRGTLLYQDSKRIVLRSDCRGYGERTMFHQASDSRWRSEERSRKRKRGMGEGPVARTRH